MRKIMLLVVMLGVIVLPSALWLAVRHIPVFVGNGGAVSGASLQERVEALENTVSEESLRALTARVRALEVRLREGGAPAAAQGPGAADLEAVTARVEALEQAVKEDPARSLEARVRGLEGKLRDGRTAGSGVSEQEMSDLKRSVEALQVSTRDLANRMKSVDLNQPRLSSRSLADDVREMGRDAERLEREVDELKERVRQLERAAAR